MLCHSAVLASIPGTVHWGAILSREVSHARLHLIWGVTPALFSWVLLMFRNMVSFARFISLVMVVVIMDRWLLPVPDSGYKRLRLQLSVFMITSLVIAFAATVGG
ncbi:MAG: DUF3429 domain-containing protein [bacterium]